MKAQLEDYGVATCQEESYQRIRDKIVRGEFPQGRKLVARKLAKEFGFSYIPVRDSLMKLQSEGLVVSVPRWGFLVKKYTAQDVRELYELREAVECLAVQKLALNSNSIDLSECHDSINELVRIGDCAQELSLEEYAELKTDLDEKFHRSLLKASQNSRFEAIWSNFHFQRICMVSSKDVHSIKDESITLEHHKSIIDAIENGKVDRAVETMRNHIRNAKNSLLTSYTE